jgi:hypothetical protein
MEAKRKKVTALQAKLIQLSKMVQQQQQQGK